MPAASIGPVAVVVSTGAAATGFTAVRRVIFRGAVFRVRLTVPVDCVVRFAILLKFLQHAIQRRAAAPTAPRHSTGAVPRPPRDAGSGASQHQGYRRRMFRRCRARSVPVKPVPKCKAFERRPTTVSIIVLLPGRF